MTPRTDDDGGPKNRFGCKWWTATIVIFVWFAGWVSFSTVFLWKINPLTTFAALPCSFDSILSTDPSITCTHAAPASPFRILEPYSFREVEILAYEIDNTTLVATPKYLGLQMSPGSITPNCVLSTSCEAQTATLSKTNGAGVNANYLSYYKQCETTYSFQTIAAMRTIPFGDGTCNLYLPPAASYSQFFWPYADYCAAMLSTYSGFDDTPCLLYTNLDADDILALMRQAPRTDQGSYAANFATLPCDEAHNPFPTTTPYGCQGDSTGLLTTYAINVVSNVFYVLEGDSSSSTQRIITSSNLIQQFCDYSSTVCHQTKINIAANFILYTNSLMTVVTTTAALARVLGENHLWMEVFVALKDSAKRVAAFFSACWTDCTRCCSCICCCRRSNDASRSQELEATSKATE